jgi:transcriptional regulator with XRE-family HTH domain
MSRHERAKLRPLRRHLMLLGKTQAELATDVGVTAQAVSEWVNGVTQPHPKKIKRVALAMELRPDQLIDMLSAT